MEEAWTLQAVTRAKQGDRHAVRCLHSRYAAAVRAHTASMLDEPDAVDDVVCATFLKVAREIDGYDVRQTPFEAWLMRIARTAASEHRPGGARLQLERLG